MSEAVEAPTAALPAGVVDSSSPESDDYARVLLLGPMKSGKTTSLLTTATSKPLLINCDAAGAANYSKKMGASFFQFDCFNVNGVGSQKRWTEARRAAKQLVESGQTNIIIVDTISLLADHLLEDISLTASDGFETYRKLYAEIVGGYKRLASLPAHIFLVGHMDPREDEIAGIMPLLPGKSQAIVPALVADWVLFNYDSGRKPERCFVIGPQEKWTHSGRNIKRSAIIDADMAKLFDELGIAP